MAIIESNDPLVTLVSINNITIEVNGGIVQFRQKMDQKELLEFQFHYLIGLVKKSSKYRLLGS